MKVYLMCFILLITGNQVTAKSFGVVGETFPIAEKSFLELIYERLRALDWKKVNQDFINTVAEHSNRPKPLPLKRALLTARHDYIPEVILSKDILDAKGTILYPKDTRINALEKLPAYTPCWLFFNADDEAELRWAEKQKGSCVNFKLILTGGAIHPTETRLQAPIYFDQAGRITQKLHIAHTPAKVTRMHNKLVIEEQAIKENGDVL